MMCYVWWTWSGAARKYWQLVRKKNVVVSVDQIVTVAIFCGGIMPKHALTKGGRPL